MHERATFLSETKKIDVSFSCIRNNIVKVVYLDQLNFCLVNPLTVNLVNFDSEISDQ